MLTLNSIRKTRPHLLLPWAINRAALTLHTRSHAVKNTSQSREETDNTPTEKTEQVTSDMFNSIDLFLPRFNMSFYGDAVAVGQDGG